MNGLLAAFPKDLMTRARFAAAGFLVSLAVLVPGAVWYKSAVATMARTSSQELAASLKSRVITLRQQLATELAVLVPEMWADRVAGSSPRLRRDLPFDLVVIFDKSRRIVDGFRLISATKSNADLSDAASRSVIPADSGFFDRVTVSADASGLIIVDGRPMLIAVRRVALGAASEKSAYALVGRWLDARRLASNGEQVESGIEIFSMLMENTMPADVRESIPLAQRSDGFTYTIDRAGSGLVYALIDDIGGRPAVVARLPWTLPWRASGTYGFGVFYLAAIFAGVCAWGALTMADRKNRRRVRRFDGLSSLKEEHIRTLVEAFPGYAFAVKSSMEYVGVSRVMAGVTGQEPSYFAGQAFGSLSAEKNDVPLPKIFVKLKDPNQWPRSAKISHVVEGLGERFEFTGMAHYLAKQDLLLVILSPNEEQAAKGLPVYVNKGESAVA